MIEPINNQSTVPMQPRSELSIAKIIDIIAVVGLILAVTGACTLLTYRITHSTAFTLTTAAVVGILCVCAGSLYLAIQLREPQKEEEPAPAAVEKKPVSLYKPTPPKKKPIRIDLFLQ